MIGSFHDMIAIETFRLRCLTCKMRDQLRCTPLARRWAPLHSQCCRRQSASCLQCSSVLSTRIASLQSAAQSLVAVSLHCRHALLQQRRWRANCDCIWRASMCWLCRACWHSVLYFALGLDVWRRQTSFFLFNIIVKFYNIYVYIYMCVCMCL